MHRRPTATWILPTLCGLLCCAAAHAADWPRFRGPNGTGISTDKDVPVQWSDKEGILWKVPIPGRGNSSPIVWDDKLFIQSAAEDGSERWLFCLNAATGAEIWKKTASGSKAHTHQKNTLASSTPATDGERVYAIFWDGKGLELTAYDVAGAQVWTRDLGSYESEHGAGISPMVYDGRVYVADDQGASQNYDTTAPSTVMAFNAKDGTDVWKAQRKSFRSCYSTPFILETEKGKPELIVASTAGVTSYDPVGGSENWNYVWSFPTHPLRTVASPITAGGLVIANAGEGGAGRSLVAVTKSSLALPVLGASTEGLMASPLSQGPFLAASALFPGRSANLVWNDEKSYSYVPTLLASGDNLFCVNDDGFASCHNVKTGGEAWTKRLGGHFSSSPVLIDGKIYATNEKGDVYVFEANPKEYKLLAKNSLSEDVMSSPAVSNNRLYIRTTNSLFCIGRSGKSTGQ